MLYPDFKGYALDAYNKTVAVLKQRAMTQLKLGPNEIIVRPALGSDMGFTKTYFDATALAVTAWTTMVSNVAIGTGRYVGIYGIYAQPAAVSEFTQVKIVRAGSDARYWDTQALQNFQNKTAWADDPVTLDQNTTVSISAYARTANTITDYAFLGVVVEKRGLVVNPPGDVPME